MLNCCYYYDPIRLEYVKTDFKKMLQLEIDNPAEFIRRRSNLYRREDGKIPMVMVKKGLHHGFRRKGNPGGNTADYSRGEKESLTHQGNKEVIADLKEIVLKFGKADIKLEQSSHVETVCLLERMGNRKPDTRVKISVETEELKKVKEEK